MKLRDYQEKAVAAVIESWKHYRSSVVILPTGCGKTVVFAEVIKRRLNSRVMVLAHREELIMQASEKIKSVTLADTGIEMGAITSDGETLLGPEPPIIVSTVQTQITGRIGKFAPEEFATLVIDEAHHATSKSYRACIDHYFTNPDCRLLGVTATPDRADEKALGTVFEHVAYEYSVADAIRDGWLVPINQKLVNVGSLDFSSISTTAGDFNQGELAEVLEQERNLHAIAVPTVEICGTKRAIIFAASVRQADRLAEIINRLGRGKAQWLCGKTPKFERRQLLQDFRDGRIQYLVNVGVLTEGFDDAGVEIVVMARPTKSRALYAQMAGRGTRPHGTIAAQLGDLEKDERIKLIAASPKPSCLIVDFVGNSGKHKLVSTLDILGGKIDADEEEARSLVRKRCQTSDNVNTLEELEKAREEVKERKLIDAKRRAFIQATAKYSVTSVDPFNVYDLQPVDKTAKSNLDSHSLSWKQRAIIREKLKISPDSISPAEGRMLLDEYFRRINQGLATYGQMKYLRKHGYPMPMTFAEASATINHLLGAK